MIKQNIRDGIATRLAGWMRHFVLDPRYFELWQSHGFHVKPVHFYSPLPDTRQLQDSLFSSASELAGVEMNEAFQLQLLDELRDQFRSEYDLFPTEKPDEPGTFYFGNTSLEAGDAEMLYAILPKIRPFPDEFWDCSFVPLNVAGKHLSIPDDLADRISAAMKSDLLLDDLTCRMFAQRFDALFIDNGDKAVAIDDIRKRCDRRSRDSKRRQRLRRWIPRVAYSKLLFRY